MGLGTTVKKVLSWGFAPRTWMGLEHVKTQANVCRELAKGLVPENQVRIDDGEENAQPASWRLARLLCLVYLGLGICALVYAWYLFFIKVFILAGFVSIAIALLLFSYSLRESVFYVQLRLNRNRITFRELFKFLLKRFSR